MKANDPILICPSCILRDSCCREARTLIPMLEIALCSC
jgi:hypothetical protein